jgi:hypothetical protein
MQIIWLTARIWGQVQYIEILSSQKNNYRIVRAKGKVLKSFYRRGIFPKPEEECSTSCFLLELNCCTTVASSLRFLAWFKQCWDMSRLAWGGGGRGEGGCQLTSPRQTAGGGFNFNIEKLASTFSRQHSRTWEYTYSTYVWTYAHKYVVHSGGEDGKMEKEKKRLRRLQYFFKISWKV